MKKNYPSHYFITIFISAFLILPCRVGIAQKRFTYGPEIGINSSGIPYSNQADLSTYTSYYSVKTEESSKPIVSPVVGFWIKESLGNHFSASFAIQYYRVGENYLYSYIQQYSGSYPFTDIQEEFTNQEFHKFSFPLLLEYNFHIKKIKAFTFLGYSQSYYLNGNEYVKSQDVSNSYINDVTEKNFNPFDKKPFFISAKRYQPSIVFGFGANITSKISISINLAINSALYYGQDYGQGSYSDAYQNSDYSLLLKYSL